MSEDTKCIIASNLTAAYYAGNASRPNEGDVAVEDPRGPTMDEVIRAYHQMIKLLDIVEPIR